MFIGGCHHGEYALHPVEVASSHAKLNVFIIITTKPFLTTSAPGSIVLSPGNTATSLPVAVCYFPPPLSLSRCLLIVFLSWTLFCCVLCCAPLPLRIPYTYTHLYTDTDWVAKNRKRIGDLVRLCPLFLIA